MEVPKSKVWYCMVAIAAASLACVGWSIRYTTVSAPGLSASAAADLPADFGSEVLTLVVWEKFDYVYGEGGERREGFVLAPPRVLERSQLDRLGLLTKSLPYSRKTVDGRDEGTWERGHRPHGLVLVSASGTVVRFLARDNPPQDFEVSWWSHSSAQLTEADAVVVADALSCPVLTKSGGENNTSCTLGALFGVLFSADAVKYHEPNEEPVLTLDFDDAPREAAALFLQSVFAGG